jgi:hypothetical protein
MTTEFEFITDRTVERESRQAIKDLMLDFGEITREEHARYD